MSCNSNLFENMKYEDVIREVMEIQKIFRSERNFNKILKLE